MGKNGATNQWAAEDVNGGPLVIRLGGDGRYEIVRPDNRNGGAHNNTRALEMKDPLAADQRRGFAALAPNRDAADNNPRSLGIFQKLLDRHYQPGD